MNSRYSLNLFLIILGFVIIVGIIFLYCKIQDYKNTALISKEYKNLKEIVYENISPDGLNKIVLYNTIFDSSIYRDYYKDYFDNSIIISVRDIKDGTENYLFVGGQLGEPKWLGDEHVFFTSYCGSGCRGIYLVNVLNKETRFGTISTMDFKKNKPTYTIFQDWFSKEFKLNGLVDEIRSETLGNKTYLIFSMSDDEQKIIKQKRLLFAGSELREL